MEVMAVLELTFARLHGNPVDRACAVDVDAEQSRGLAILQRATRLWRGRQGRDPTHIQKFGILPGSRGGAGSHFGRIPQQY